MAVKINCPACSATTDGSRTRCECGADISLLVALDAVPDAWFNRALEAVHNGQTGEALEWIAACCKARPTDVEAFLVLARLWAQLRRWRDAERALDRAAEIEPDNSRLNQVRAAIEDARERRRRRRRTAREAALSQEVGGDTAGRPRTVQKEKR